MESLSASARERTPEQQFNTWVRPLQAIEREGELKLLAPNRYVIEWLGQNSLPASKSSSGVCGGLVRMWCSTWVPARGRAERRCRQRRGGQYQQSRTRRRRRGQDAAVCAHGSGSRINPDATFDSFVEGKSNQLAKAAAIQSRVIPARPTTRCSFTAASAWAKRI